MRGCLPARIEHGARGAARQGGLAHSPLSFLDSSKTGKPAYHCEKRFRNGCTRPA
jgi:hypothetical protein